MCFVAQQVMERVCASSSSLFGCWTVLLALQLLLQALVCAAYALVKCLYNSNIVTSLVPASVLRD